MSRKAGRLVMVDMSQSVIFLFCLWSRWCDQLAATLNSVTCVWSRLMLQDRRAMCLVSSLCIRVYVLILILFLDWCVECLACSLLAGWMLWWQDKSPTEYSSRPGVEISGARLPGPHSARVTAPGPWSPLTTSHRGEMAHEQGWIIFSNVDEI